MCSRSPASCQNHISDRGSHGESLMSRSLLSKHLCSPPLKTLRSNATKTAEYMALNIGTAYLEERHINRECASVMMMMMLMMMPMIMMVTITIIITITEHGPH